MAASHTQPKCCLFYFNPVDSSLSVTTPLVLYQSVRQTYGSSDCSEVAPPACTEEFSCVSLYNISATDHDKGVGTNAAMRDIHINQTITCVFVCLSFLCTEIN